MTAAVRVPTVGAPAAVLRSHAGIEEYRSWVGEFVPNQAAK